VPTTDDAPITLDTDLTKLKRRRGYRPVSGGDFTWLCPDCGRRTHISSDWCHASPGCLAKYWRAAERSHREEARKASEEARRAADIAASLEAEAAKEAAQASAEERP
jgi:hypothetical protein